MLPVARANLDNICCICLVDIQPSVFKQRVYDVKKEKNLSKLLMLTAHITVLKNPLNLKYTIDYCRKVCEICFVKIQYSFNFREKILASAITLKELFENGSLREEADIRKLQHFCRFCLNRQSDVEGNNCKINNKHLKWIKDCTGIRYNSLRETETFRIKEGTNINELVTINDELFPKQVCQICLKKLRNVDEFRSLATQSFDYMISVMGYDNESPPDLLNKQDLNKFKKEIVWKKIPYSQKISLKDSNSQRKRAYYEDEVLSNKELETISYPEENIERDQCTQSQEIVWDNQYAPNVDLTEYCTTEIIGGEELNYEMEDDFDFIDTLPASIDTIENHSESKAIDNREISYEGSAEDGDHNFFATVNEESLLSDYDVTDKGKQSTSKPSKQVRELYMTWPDFFYPPSNI